MYFSRNNRLSAAETIRSLRQLCLFQKKSFDLCENPVCFHQKPSILPTPSLRKPCMFSRKVAFFKNPSILQKSLRKPIDFIEFTDSHCENPSKTHRFYRPPLRSNPSRGVHQPLGGGVTGSHTPRGVGGRQLVCPRLATWPSRLTAGQAGRVLLVWQPSQEVQSFHGEDDFGPLFGQILSPETFTNDSCLKHAAEIIGDYPGGQIHACSGQDYHQNASHADRTLANMSKLCGGLRATENYFESKTYLRFVCR